MNIYLHVEISSRELDSKLLLATLAASRGHRVIVSDFTGIEKGVNNGVLTPGIFHTKSLSAYKVKIARHQKMIDKGFNLVTVGSDHRSISSGAKSIISEMKGPSKKEGSKAY